MTLYNDDTIQYYDYNDSQCSEVNLNNNNTPELYLNNNPSYEVNTTKQVTIHQSETTYDVVSPPPSKQASGLPERMQSYDKFNHRRQVKGRQHALSYMFVI